MNLQKIYRGRDKDLADIDHFLGWIEKQDNFDWELLSLSRENSRSELFKKGVKKFIFQPKKTIRKAQNLLVEKVGKGIKTYLSGELLTVKMLDLGVLIQLQYYNQEFQRYDVIIRKSLLKLS